MRSSHGESPLAWARAGVAALAGADVPGLPDDQVRTEILALIELGNAVNAALSARLVSFDRRDLAKVDGFRGVKPWLIAFGRLAPAAASAQWKRARLLDQMPQLAAAALTGQVSPEHVGKIVQLADKIGVEKTAAADETLAVLAAAANPEDVAIVCERIRAHVDPDGPAPDPDAYQRRGLTLARQGSLVAVRGLLDPEGGAALATALDALMRPPAPDDERTATMRRADALVDLARQALTGATLPTVGGVRPQVGLLITPDQWQHARTLLGLNHNNTANDATTGARACTCGLGTTTNGGASGPLGSGPPGSGPPGSRPPGSRPPGNSPTRSGPPGSGPPGSSGPPDANAPPGSPTDLLTAAGIPPAPAKPWLEWYGELDNPKTAERISCDATIWRTVLDPAHGLPLDVGRAYRTAPPWLRKALHARDRGCRWPGCTVPASWCDAHHRIHWLHGGITRIEDLVLLCRHHHVNVHEGGWTIHLNPHTGDITITRPDGTPYELGPSRAFTRSSR